MRGGILVVAERRNGVPTAASQEAVGAALALGRTVGAEVLVLVVGGGPADARRASGEGVARILHLVDAPEHFDPLLYERAAADCARRLGVRLVVAPHSADSMAYAAGIAVALGAGFCSDVVALTADDGALRATREIFGNKLAMELDLSGPEVAVVTLRGGAFRAPVATGEAPVEALPAPAIDPNLLTQHLSTREAPAAAVDIRRAERIVAVGRGVKDKESVARMQALADKLGAALACSRPIADSGWLPKAHQVGQSGRTAASCRLYLALGISGAPQHLQGMQHVETVIAVNTDPSAPIFQHARYGTTLDAAALAEALERQLG